jgi:WD40 repeat protein
MLHPILGQRPKKCFLSCLLSALGHGAMHDARTVTLEHTMSHRHWQWPVASTILLTLILSSQGQSVHTDMFGDPLPRGALARLGTMRFRHADFVSLVAFLPDSKSLLTVGNDQTVRVWDIGTGKEMRRFGKPPVMNQDGNSCFMPGRLLRPEWRLFLACLSGDRKLLATGLADGPIQLWEAASGRALRLIDRPLAKMPVRLPGDPPVSEFSGPSALALSRDHKVLAATTDDGMVHLWDTETGKEMRQFRVTKKNPMNPGGLYLAFEFSPDGRTLLTCYEEVAPDDSDGVFRFWDVATGKQRFEVKQDGEGPSMTGKAIYAPDGKTVALATPRLGLRLIDANTGRELFKLEASYFGARFGFSRDSKELVADGGPGVRAYDVMTGRKVPPSSEGPASSRLQVNGDPYSSPSPDGKRLAQAHQNTVRLLDAISGEDQHPGYASQATVNWAGFSRDGSSVLTCSDDDDFGIRLWETRSGKAVVQIAVPPSVRSSGFSLSPDGETMVATAFGNGVAVWDVRSESERFSIRSKKIGFSARAFSPDSKLLALEEMLVPVIHLYDVATGNKIRQLEVPHPTSDQPATELPFPMAGSLGLTFSPDGRRIVGPSLANVAGVWDVVSGRLLGQIALVEASPPQVMAISPDGRSVATASADNYVSLYEVMTGQRRRYFGKKPAEGGNWQADLAVYGPAAFVRVLANADGVVRSRFSESPTNLVFSSDGKLLCHGRMDQTIALWEADTGRRLGLLQGHQGPVTALGVSPDGKRLVSGSSDASALIWDLEAFRGHLQQPRADLSRQEMDHGWAALASSDAATAFEAICLLSTAPKSVVPFLQERLRPADPIDTKRIERSIADLDAGQFRVRQAAGQQLEQLGERALPALRQALERKPTLEVRQRIDELLKSMASRAIRNGNRLRTLRAIEILERIGTAEALRVLQTMATGAKDARETEEARASLTRLGKPPAGKP